jgi:hypothetical protein
MRRRCVLRVVFVSYASSSGLTPRGWDLARPLVGEFQARVMGSFTLVSYLPWSIRIAVVGFD